MHYSVLTLFRTFFLELCLILVLLKFQYMFNDYISDLFSQLPKCIRGLL
jgi:uncharacterized membrane protein